MSAPRHPGAPPPVPPPAALRIDADDFTLFGLPPRQGLSREAVDARWRELQARVHPDRFAAEGAAAQRLAMQWALRVNEAHRRLRDPLQRAAQLCALRGVPVDPERNTAMPPAFLVQQMQWREALADAVHADAVRALADTVAGAERELLATLERMLDGGTATSDGDPAGAVGRGAGAGADPMEAARTAAAAQAVRALMFVRRFRDDVEARLDRLDPAR